MINTIETSPNIGLGPKWVATLDGYDGTIDDPSRHQIGFGETELGAIEELIDVLDGEDIVIDLMAIGLDGECDPYDYREAIQKVKLTRERILRDVHMENEWEEQKLRTSEPSQ